jgi:hypothetical protein
VARTKQPRLLGNCTASDPRELTSAPAMFAWNVALFQRINATAATPHALIALANVIAQWTIWLIPMWLTVSWFRSDAQGRRELLEVLAVTLLALGFGQAIGMAWPQPRPFMVHWGLSSWPMCPIQGSRATTSPSSGRWPVRHWPREDLRALAWCGSGSDFWWDGAGCSLACTFRWMCLARCSSQFWPPPACMHCAGRCNRSTRKW